MRLFKKIGKRLSKAYFKEPVMTHEVWAEKKIYFPNQDVSPITGYFRVRYSPHLKLPMLLLDRPEVKDIFAKWASQSAKSLFLVIAGAYKLDNEPATILYMQPIKDDVPKILRIKINPILKCIKDLWNKFEDYKTTEAIRTKDAIKQLAGGSWVVSGSSVKERKSLSIMMLLLDEMGEFENGATEEASERLKAYSMFFPKRIGASTIVHPKDEICTQFDNCEAILEWRYKCPNCKESFYPSIETFKFLTQKDYMKEKEITELDFVKNEYKKEALKEVYIECPHCKYRIDNTEKKKLILNNGMDWFFIRGDMSATSYGLDMNSLGSYFVILEDLAAKIIDADEDPVKLDAIYRGWLNNFFYSKTSNKARSDMLSLGNNLPEWIIPNNTIRHGIYLTVDTQKDHFWYTIYAVTYGATFNLVSHGKIYSFNDIERLFEREYKDQEGKEYYISKVAIDYQGYVNKEIVIDEEGNEIIKEDIDRMEEVKTWGTAYMRKVGYDRVFLTRGVAELTNQIEFSEFKIKVTDEVVGREIDVRAWKMSNLRCASILDQKIQKSIEKQKSDNPEEYQAGLFYINQTAIDFLTDEDHKSIAIDLDRQLRAEVLKYKDNKATKMTYIPISRENHLWDTSKMAVMLSAIDNLAAIPKPTKVESASEVIRKIGKVF
jgi:phage terminase large subunit GpA-like protein